MDFNFYSPSRLFFGPGKISSLSSLAKKLGSTVLVMTGSSSFQATRQFTQMAEHFLNDNIPFYLEGISGEPSPSVIDSIVQTHQQHSIDLVIAIGGGSVMDAGKAVSAMLPKNRPVSHYLEGVGHRSHDGEKVRFIAVPTTAGTGSEATKNAVISQVGKNGFKKSLRHDNFVPDMAIIDPELTLNCPPDITAACGMDALTQLLESLVSTQASPMTDALALNALNVLKDSLIHVAESPENIVFRSNISYAAYISGLTLANAGLGVVHGFASTIGGYVTIPHGVVCGTLLAGVTRKNIETLISTDPEHVALKKYGQAASLLDASYDFENPVNSATHLADLLENWSNQLDIPGLGAYGITLDDIKPLAEKTGIKNNPCNLSPDILSQILKDNI